MANKDYIEKRIEEETAKIKVDSYHKTASLGGWGGGGRTLWAISALAAVIGAGIGLLAPFTPMIVGMAAPSLATIGTSVLAFAATGISTGFAGGLMLGRITGAASAVAEESELRMKEWMVRQKIAQDPSFTVAPDGTKEKPSAKSFGKRLSDTYHTYVNPRIGMIMATIGIVGGLIIGGALLATGSAGYAIMPALEKLTGLTLAELAVPKVMLAYTAGVTGLVGAVWSFNVPKIASSITEFTGKLIGGKIIGREWAPKKEILRQPAQAYTAEPQISEAAVRKYESFQEQVLAQRAAEEKAATEQLIPR